MSDSAATVPREVIVRLDDRAARLRECLSAQLEADYPLTYERIYWLVCGVTDYLSPLLKDGRPTPVESLLDADDLAVMEMDRDA